MAERIVTLSWEHPRYGYRRIRTMLVKEGWTTSGKFVQAVRRSEGLQVKPPKKRRHRQGVSTGPPTKATGRNHVWSWDFVHDRTDNGGPLKMMTLIDEYTRKCLDIRVARQLTSADVFSVLSEAIEEEGDPSYIRSDNRSEFIANQVERWLPEKDIKAIYIDVFKDSLQYWGPVPCVPALSQRGFIAVAKDQERPSVKEFRIPACGRVRLRSSS